MVVVEVLRITTSVFIEFYGGAIFQTEQWWVYILKPRPLRASIRACLNPRPFRPHTLLIFLQVQDRCIGQLRDKAQQDESGVINLQLKKNIVPLLQQMHTCFYVRDHTTIFKEN